MIAFNYLLAINKLQRHRRPPLFRHCAYVLHGRYLLLSLLILLLSNVRVTLDQVTK